MNDETSRPVANATDVARLAGVSQSAVSRTFTEGASVSEKTRKKVVDAAAAIGYRPNLLARSLIKGKSKIVGLAMGNLENEFFPLALDALSKSLSQAGHRVLIFTADPNAQVDAQIDEVLNYRVDALVLLSTSLSSALAQRCHDAGIPVIFFNRTAPVSGEIFSVTGDNQTGSEKIGRHLLECGYKNIAFMAGFIDSSTSHDRECVFTEFLVHQGLSAPIREVGHFTREGALIAARKLLSAKNRPDAIFCANDHMAIATIDVARYEFGLEIGREIGIAGFDDVPMASWPGYQITTFSQPVQPMAERVTDYVLNEGKIAGAERHTVIPGELIIRASTRTPK
ncbi:MAG: LacI family DNA-binding transcriptional regulator [Spongiibacteraceae bacterium]|nr:LacI family DNA-binding transcriptional regulator [Spongiibacteraceae bacterium]